MKTHIKKNFLQLLLLSVVIYLLIPYPLCFAISYAYPWYFRINRIEECWKIAIKKGEGVLVDILDSKVHFVSTLKDKEYFSKCYINQTRVDFNELIDIDGQLRSWKSKVENNRYNVNEILINEIEDIVKKVKQAQANKVTTMLKQGKVREVVNNISIMLEEARAIKIHGTAMAGLIAGNADNSICNELGIVAAGLVPNAKIISREWIREYTSSKGDLEKAILDATDEQETIPVDENGKPAWKTDRELKLFLLNISSGKKGEDIISWKKRIRELAKNNANFLIVAAVGNEGKKLTTESQEDYGLIPAILNRAEQGEKDPIIRVGALKRYDSKETPERYFNSNYGKNFVDIMAPGQDIPIITPTPKEVIMANGTSEATAIVSGAAALLASCNPSATADGIKHVILDNVDKYSSLEKDVENGRVLNIYNAVSNYCRETTPDMLSSDHSSQQKQEL